MIITLAAAVLSLLISLPFSAFAAPAAGDTKIDAVLSVDVSSSMNESDVNKVSYEAMKMFIDMASVQGDKVGVVAYTDQILREKALLKINSAQDKQNLKSFIDQLTRGPYTDVAVGVNEAVKILESGGGEAGHVPLIVLLTDGNNSLNTGKTQEQSDQMLNQAVKKAKEKNIPIYTIGLNADGKLNKDALERISNETGGKLFITSTADNLPKILSEIYASHLKLKVVPLTGFTANGDFQDVTVNIPNASVLEANISIMSSKPVEVKLVNPAGQEQTIPSDKIVFSSSSAYTLIKLLSPAQGDWKLRIKGVPKEKIDINLIYNYDVQVSMELSSSISYKPGDAVPVKAYLQANGQKATDASLYKNAKATLLVTDLDTKKTSEVPLTTAAQGFEGTMKVAEAHDYEVKVKVEDANFVRESQPASISAKKAGAAPAPTAPSTTPAEGSSATLITPIAWIGGALLLLIAAALFALSMWKKANKGFFGQMVVEVKDEDTGDRTSPQYRKLNAFKGKVDLHQLLQLAPEFAETKQIIFKPGPGDTIVLYNQSSCIIEKGGRVFDAVQGKELKNNDRIKISLQNVNKSVTVEYLK
ncbi:VWA domain-containing protein [Paenibacillus radicis (ex Xue et al. 2023)]|uniref:VWA domain-containing protein n=1 Tax=Paenibacillus radicis (ex Xue et al. 2023) TaxID=2972489 RepID=A0ABT1YTF3_9BACL|nr:VWA domain-containing protein [Paenibacillus radicis (ex Xue et al. 2023)]MCR8635265.1 VWA domain-containing protein [Paenibacillus radicis (ex Xue et al. 2023)]